MRRTGEGGSWTAPGEDNIETRLWEEPHSTYLQAACCLVWLGEGDDDDGGEDEEPDQVGGGEEDGWDDAGVGNNQTESRDSRENNATHQSSLPTDHRLL